MAEMPEKVPLSQDTSSPPPPYSDYEKPYGQQPYPQQADYPTKGGYPGAQYPQHPGAYPPHGAYPQPYLAGQPGQEAIIVTQPRTVTIIQNQEPRPSPVAAIVFSCFVIWCCCWPIGLVAFCVAVCATTVPDANQVRQRLKTANMISISGVVVGIIMLIILVIYEIAVAKNDDYGYN